VSLYWHTNAIRSSMRLYSESLDDWDATETDWADAAEWARPGGPLAVPTAFALFPKDIGLPPREFAERFFTVERFTLLPRAATSEPWKSLCCSPTT